MIKEKGRDRNDYYNFLKETIVNLEVWSDDSLNMIGIGFYIATVKKLLDPEKFPSLSRVDHNTKPWERDLQLAAIAEVKAALNNINKEVKMEGGNGHIGSYDKDESLKEAEQLENNNVSCMGVENESSDN